MTCHLLLSTVSAMLERSFIASRSLFFLRSHAPAEIGLTQGSYLFPRLHELLSYDLKVCCEFFRAGLLESALRMLSEGCNYAAALTPPSFAITRAGST